jgi:hypothetical protein
MLPLSHTYVSTKVTGLKSPLLIFGSILPDIATTSSQQIGRDKIHNSPRELYKFIAEKYPELTDLALGVRLHSQVDGGADFYSDDMQVGYAKLEGEKISTEVAELLGIPKGDASLLLAHNFIEMAVDLHLYKNSRYIWESYIDAIESVKTEFPVIAKCLGEYLEIDQDLVLTELNNLIVFLDPKSVVSKEMAVQKIALPLIKLRFQKDVSYQSALDVVNKALTITEPSYKGFLNRAVTEVKKNIYSKIQAS